MKKNELEKFYAAWEFCKDSQALFDELHYKSVTKYLVKKWEEEMKRRGLVEKIEYQGSPCHILIHFPWEGERHLSIWIDNKKDKLGELITKLQWGEKRALARVRGETYES